MDLLIAGSGSLKDIPKDLEPCHLTVRIIETKPSKKKIKPYKLRGEFDHKTTP
jgi:hypothetical protein